MLIGEAPGQEEDKSGLTFKVRLEIFLNKMLIAININDRIFILSMQLILDLLKIGSLHLKK